MWHPLSAESEDVPWKTQALPAKPPMKSISEGCGETLVALPAKPLVRLQPDHIFRELVDLSSA